jgi:GMP synthase (glutamine-hydrolysing)
VLGICLGSQLLARLLGARVYKSPKPEFGFKRITLMAEGRADPVMSGLVSGGNQDFLAMEWHSDVWDLPAGAVRLASSAAWENQAFRYGPNVLATQFHLEFTQPHMAWAASKSAGEVPADPTGEDLASFSAPGPRYDEVRRNMETLLSGFLG